MNEHNVLSKNELNERAEKHEAFTKPIQEITPDTRKAIREFFDDNSHRLVYLDLWKLSKAWQIDAEMLRKELENWCDFNGLERDVAVLPAYSSHLSKKELAFKAFEQNNYRNISELSKRLDISRPTLYKYLEEFSEMKKRL